MTVKQLLEALRARWRTLTAVLLLCLAAGVAMVLALKPEYTVEATVMLDIKTADPIGGAAIPTLGISNYIATQSDLMRSSRVLGRALKAAHFDSDPAIDAAWRKENGGQGDKLDWLEERLLKRFIVTPARESSMIALAYTDTNPQRATDFLRALLDSYIATNIDLRTEVAARNNVFFEGQLKQLRETLSQAQAKLSDFQREAGVLANDERLDVENARLTELSNQLLTARMAEGDTGSRSRASRDQVDSTPEALNNTAISAMTAELGRQEARVEELSARLGDEHPELQQARANVAALKRRISLATDRIGKSLQMANSVQVTNVAQLQRAYDEQREKLARLKGMRDRAGILQRDFENANQAFVDTATRARQTSMESQAALTNASVVQAPSLPVKPSRPRPTLTMVLATLMGLLLGIVAALLRELLDRRLRSEDDVALLLSQPLLVQLPFRPASAG